MKVYELINELMGYPAGNSVCIIGENGVANADEIQIEDVEHQPGLVLLVIGEGDEGEHA